MSLAERMTYTQRQCVLDFLRACQEIYKALLQQKRFSWHWFLRGVDILPTSRKEYFNTPIGKVYYCPFEKSKHSNSYSMGYSIRTKPTTIMTKHYVEV